MYKCKHCNEIFENRFIMASHTKWCDKNPKKYIHITKCNKETNLAWYENVCKINQSEDKIKRQKESLNEYLKYHTPHGGRASTEEKEKERRRKISVAMKKIQIVVDIDMELEEVRNVSMKVKLLERFH